MERQRANHLRLALVAAAIGILTLLVVMLANVWSRERQRMLIATAATTVICDNCNGDLAGEIEFYADPGLVGVFELLEVVVNGQTIYKGRVSSGGVAAPVHFLTYRCCMARYAVKAIVKPNHITHKAVDVTEEKQRVYIGLLLDGQLHCKIIPPDQPFR